MYKVSQKEKEFCRGGEIGRRTSFRSWRPQGRAGSIPVPGTRNIDI